MKKYEIAFGLNTYEKIVIMLEEPINVVHRAYTAPIIFFHDNQRYVVADSLFLSIWDNMFCFVKVLKRVLAKEAELDESIKLNELIGKDIGYLYNQYLQNKPGLISIKYDDEDYELWVGYTHGLWGGARIKAWLYNDADGDIIIKLTPIFPGKFQLGEPTESEELANAAWYNEWIQTYKPILERRIPREVAEKWLAQAEELIKTIEANDRRMAAEYEASLQKKCEIND